MGRKIDKLVPLKIRAAALMPAAVLTVHQLRYQLAFGSRADSKLAFEGHQYLGAFAPLAAMLLAGIDRATFGRLLKKKMPLAAH